MTQLTHHNNELISIFENDIKDHDLTKFSELVSLDSIDIVLRKFLDLSEMKEAGSFFTGQHLATALISKISKNISNNSLIIDPTCGAGNLLIECARYLTVENTLSETLKAWGKVLYGYDLHQSFIDAAKLRLIFKALSQGAVKNCSLEEALSYLPNIFVSDVMSLEKKHFEDATHIIMNPPFSNWLSPRTRFWKAGKVNAAGVVFEKVLNLIQEDCHVCAILPDVLRSGSRYENWRNFTESNFEGDCEVYGRFNKKTDVDVFILSGFKKEVTHFDLAWSERPNLNNIVSDFFDVCIGPLVAYRDPQLGNEYPYIHSRIAPAWGVMVDFSETRKFSGKVFSPPLVVIRRTSSPSDKYRAVATLVLGEKKVAVENHMIVLAPKDGLILTCEKLMQNLKTDLVNDFLNKRIRLRHLTVGVIKELPYNQG